MRSCIRSRASPRRKLISYSEGAVRFLSPGRLKFDRDVKEFHRDKMQDRVKADGLMLTEKQNYLLVETDVLQVAREQYDRWPLYG